MNSVKTLLLGTAAGLVAVAGAQAADMPVKAAPVQYVKICSLYGDGFYYIPGTDTCLKMGGYLRVQAEYNMGGGGVVVGDSAGGELSQGRFTRDLTNDINYRVRGAISWDVRQQTEYGTLRTYIRFGVENTTPGGHWRRHHLQLRSGIARSSSLRASRWAGRSRSSTSSPTAAPTATTTCGSPVIPAPRARTSGPIPPSSATASPARCRSKTPQPARVARWTWRRRGFAIPATALVTDNAFAINQRRQAFGFRVPDIIANLRVDQAWGFAGISAASA